MIQQMTPQRERVTRGLWSAAFNYTNKANACARYPELIDLTRANYAIVRSILRNLRKDNTAAYDMYWEVCNPKFMLKRHFGPRQPGRYEKVRRHA
jgi:hypothetical protein